jgi:hypothetical protein
LTSYRKIVNILAFSRYLKHLALKGLTTQIFFNILFIAFTVNSFSQSNLYFKDLIKYKKWGIIAGPVLYTPAEAILLDGTYAFDNKIMWGFNAGVEYDFAPEKRWSIVSGLYLS